MIMYKVPIELISVEELKKTQGDNGVFLAPIQDANDNWVVSVEEWEATEFHYLKEKYPDIAAGFEKIDTQLKDYSYLDYGNI